MENQQEKNNAVPIWGGIECTVHRLRNSYGNQLFRNGHHSRISDLDLIAELGIKTLRYPVVWESIAPEGLKTADWSWIDERLYRLKELGINPIASFLHHGSGPKYTSLIDPQFPEKLTEFAVAVAERYPWLELFTPVNEPLTTARFSCLYGHWYPHTKDHHAFSIALLNECKGTIMAMKEIKKIIPNAKLVQTEDLGKCHATEKLQYQCDFENERRWVTFDLLTGRIEENEMMMEYFKGKGKIEDSDLAYFKENNYAPDVVGINYYITSERALDENYKKYPKWSYAVNDNNEKYANVEIVRADINKREGHYKLLKEAADRYKLPVAFTEVHLGATRDEQLRWFMEAYEAVTKLKDEGVDVKGITVWSVLGAYDWNTLLTQNNNFYEPGVFDVRSGTPRPTAIAWLVKTLSEGQQPDHPVLHAEGWWKNPGTIKIMFGNKAKARQLPTIESLSTHLPSPTISPVLITGATGTLGSAFARMCKIRSISYVLLSRSDMDIASQASVEAAMEKYKPWAVINAAGYVKIDAAESNSELCLRENAIGPAVMAAACEKYGAMFLTFSSDMVFNGASRTPYVESDPTAPLNIYGMSKFYAETKVLAENPSALVIRTSSFFGPWDKHNFVASMIESIEQGRTFLAASDLVVSPTYVPDLVNNCLDLIIDKAKGIWHLTNPSAVSWADFAFASAEALKLDTDLIKITNAKQLGYIATRPSFSVLSSERGCLLPKLEDAIDRFVSERIDEHGVKRKIQTQTSQELITSEGQEVAISNAS